MALNNSVIDQVYTPQSKYYTTSEFISNFNSTGPNNNLHFFSLLNIKGKDQYWKRPNFKK